MTSTNPPVPDPTIQPHPPVDDVITMSPAGVATPPPGNVTPPPAYAPVPAPYQHGTMPAGRAPVSQIRSTGVCMLLAIVTLGIYQIVWFYKVHKEMKDHTGTGLGGGLGAVLAFIFGIVMPFITASEVGNMYTRAGKQAPVTGTTGFWYFPGNFILVGPFVWFIKTNGAINAYWRSLGAV